MQQLPEIQKNGSCSLTIQGIGSQSSTYPTKTWHVVSHPEGQPLPEIIKMAPAAKIFKIEAHGQLVTQSHRRQILTVACGLLSLMAIIAKFGILKYFTRCNLKLMLERMGDV